MLQPYAKFIWINLSPSSLILQNCVATILYKDKAETFFFFFTALNLPALSTELLTPGFRDFLSFFSADPLKLSQVEWGLSVDICRSLQRRRIGSQGSGQATQGQIPLKVKISTYMQVYTAHGKTAVVPKHAVSSGCYFHFFMTEQCREKALIHSYNDSL